MTIIYLWSNLIGKDEGNRYHLEIMRDEVMDVSMKLKTVGRTLIDDGGP